MADDSLPDYKALWEQETELRKQAEESHRQETELRRQAEESRRQAEESRRQAEESRRQAEEASRRTTFEEFIRACHNLLSLQVEVGDKALSTKGSLTKPTGRL
ncbi:hypothetical protein V1515DRAFT_583245, partial [Lipomyces mesembrius]